MYEFNYNSCTLYFLTRAKLAKTAGRARKFTNTGFRRNPTNHGIGRRWSLVRPNNVLGGDPWLQDLEGVVAEVDPEGPVEIR